MLELQVRLASPAAPMWCTVGRGYPTLDDAIEDGQRFLAGNETQRCTDAQAFRVVDDYGTVLHEEMSDG